MQGSNQNSMLGVGGAETKTVCQTVVQSTFQNMLITF